MPNHTDLEAAVTKLPTTSRRNSLSWANAMRVPDDSSLTDTPSSGAHVIRRSRAAGERMDRVSIDVSSPQAMGFDLSEYQEMGELAREGLQLLADAPRERKAVLLEEVAFTDFLLEKLPRLQQEWKAHREALRVAGELPEDR